MPADLDFTTELTGLDRHEFLAEATRRLTALESHLGPGDQVRAAESVAMSRALAEDTADFGCFPLIYRIEAEDFQQRDGSVPSGLLELSERYRYYRIEFPVVLFPRYSWRFDRLEVRLQFTSDGPPDAVPTAREIFPNRRLMELGSLTDKFTLRLTSELRFAIDVPPIPLGLVMTGGSTGVDAATETRLTIGPFEYHLRRLIIDHTPPGTERVFWRLDDARLMQEDQPRFIVVMQAPIAADRVGVVAALQAYRDYNFLSDRVRNTIHELPEAFRTFFKNGAPLRADAQYDLTEHLRSTRRHNER